ncbi:hypothetical protein ACIQCR_32325 [Streptomyces sp. NPDC093249]|uniref:hypothetical protein n=1 Tax=Streptomyces sp. NPDC093249 TaxID=3366035 RepID=UPI0037F68CD9
MVQQVLAEPAWASRLSEEDRRGLTALFWSNVNPYGTFHLDMNKRLDLGPATAVPHPRTPGRHRRPITYGDTMKDFQDLIGGGRARLRSGVWPR